MRKTLEKIKERKAITLIALVVTIVVLLILAGVTISLLLDENGIIAKSKDARLENRAAQVEDEVGMWKQNNFINEESGQTQEEADTMLASLISRNLLKEDEIDRENEIITIKKNDGSILKQINYSQVTINISRNPETEKSGAVILTVDSVEGTTIPNISIWNEFGHEDYTELAERIELLNENQKKEIIKNFEIKMINEQDPTANCKTFEDVLEWVKNTQGQEITEEIFWSEIRDLDYEVFRIIKRECYNEEKWIIEGYTVTNPDGETSNTYIATENGTYTFKVKDNVTGKTYTKKVEVTNVDENVKYYITNIRESDIDRNTAKLITKLASTKEIKLADAPFTWCIGLRDTQTKSLQTFTTAYIIYNNQKIDISSRIDVANGYNFVTGWSIGNFLEDQTENFNRDEFEKETYQFIIEKDGIEYKGYGKVCKE